MIFFQTNNAKSFSLSTIDSEDWIIPSSPNTIERKYVIFAENEDSIQLEDFSEIQRKMNNDELISARDIYQELENVNTNQDILAFCNKYGILIDLNCCSGRYGDFRTFGVLNDIAEHFNDYSFTRQNNGMSIEHLLYYKQVLLLLDILYDLLKSKKEPKESLPEWRKLFNSLPVFFQNATTMMLFEYSCFEEGSESLFKYYPIYYYINELATQLSDQPKLSVNFLKKTDIFPASYSLLSDYFSKKTCTHDDNLEESLSKSPTAFIELAQNLFSDIAEFHLKEIPRLILLSDNFSELKGYKFSSLADVFFFQKYIDLSADHTIRKCANELCNRLFLPKQSRKKTQIYCCTECCKKTNDRNYVRRIRSNQNHTTDS